MLKKLFNSIWIEIAIVIAGAFFICIPILDFSPHMFLGGGEYLLLIQTHYIWKLLPECGTCVLWNGLFNGGAPTFAEIHNAPAHPYVFLPAIILGAVNGSKITFLLSYITAGIGQWRLSKLMGMGKIARVWTAYLMMFAGGISGKMDLGNVGLVLSVSVSILFISELCNLVLNPVTKTTYIRIGLLFSLCVTAGQGYYQIGLITILIPLALIFAYVSHGKDSIFAMVKGLALSFFLCGYYLIPLLHFLGNIGKEADGLMQNLQPIGYSVLNLVIKDITFFQNNSLGKQSIPYTYYQYIGWIPIFLAFFAIYSFRDKKSKRILLWLSLSAFLVYAIVSKEIMYPLSQKFFVIANLRYISIIITLAVPFIVGLAGLGLDALLQMKSGYISWNSQNGNGGIRISLNTMIAFAIIVFALYDSYTANHVFIYVSENHPPEQVIQDQFLSDEVRWIEPISAAFYPFFMENSAKLSYIFRPWHWKNHPEPIPEIKGQHHPSEQDPASTYRVGEMDYYVDETQAYAAIYSRAGELYERCEASTAGGGFIEVFCSAVDETHDKLIVQENYFEGWHAWVDGKRTKIDANNNFITVPGLSPGSHSIVLKYQPWDVWLGIGFSIMGCFFCFWDLFGKKKSLNNKKEGIFVTEDKIQE